MYDNTKYSFASEYSREIHNVAGAAHFVATASLLAPTPCSLAKSILEEHFCS